MGKKVLNAEVLLVLVKDLKTVMMDRLDSVTADGRKVEDVFETVEDALEQVKGE